MSAKRKKRKNKKKARRGRSDFSGLRRKTEKSAQQLGGQTVWATGGQKMSEVIIDFAQPLLDQVYDDQAKKKILAFAVTAWNVALLPKDERAKLMEELIQSQKRLAGTREEKYLRAMLEMLVERKRTHFADISRFVLDFEFVDMEDEFRFNVASTLQQPPDTSGRPKK